MIDLIYKVIDYEINLYQVCDGEKKFIESFNDREDMLIYIEKNFDLAKLYIN